MSERDVFLKNLDSYNLYLRKMGAVEQHEGWFYINPEKVEDDELLGRYMRLVSAGYAKGFI